MLIPHRIGPIILIMLLLAACASNQKRIPDKKGITDLGVIFYGAFVDDKLGPEQQGIASALSINPALTNYIIRYLQNRPALKKQLQIYTEEEVKGIKEKSRNTGESGALAFKDQYDAMLIRFHPARNRWHDATKVDGNKIYAVSLDGIVSSMLIGQARDHGVLHETTSEQSGKTIELELVHSETAIARSIATENYLKRNQARTTSISSIQFPNVMLDKLLDNLFNGLVAHKGREDTSRQSDTDELVYFQLGDLFVDTSHPEQMNLYKAYTDFLCKQRTDQSSCNGELLLNTHLKFLLQDKLAEKIRAYTALNSVVILPVRETREFLRNNWEKAANLLASLQDTDAGEGEGERSIHPYTRQIIPVCQKQSQGERKTSRINYVNGYQINAMVLRFLEKVKKGQVNDEGNYRATMISQISMPVTDSQRRQMPDPALPVQQRRAAGAASQTFIIPHNDYHNPIEVSHVVKMIEKSVETLADDLIPLIKQTVSKHNDNMNDVHKQCG